MTNPPEPTNAAGFGETAKGLAKNPLGVIALFIVLIYGLAVLVLILASSLSPAERYPLVIFLVAFPVLVLGTFFWIVAHHSSKLYAPADFRNEDNYVRMQLEAVASLTAARKDGNDSNLVSIDEMVAIVQRALPKPVIDDPRNPARWQATHRHVLWVDDRPNNNIYERRAFEAVGIRFTLAVSTADALQRLSNEQFDAIISDIGPNRRTERRLRPSRCRSTNGHYDTVLHLCRVKGARTPARNTP